MTQYMYPRYGILRVKYPVYQLIQIMDFNKKYYDGNENENTFKLIILNLCMRPVMSGCVYFGFINNILFLIICTSIKLKKIIITFTNKIIFIFEKI